MNSNSSAESYSKFSKPQYDLGCTFIEKLGLRPGQKVLDMGCGTGEITKFIADQVGPNGQVVGVDPESARIKFAQQSFQGVPGLSFEVGDSVAGFTHDDEEYYDVHFSTSSFNWQKRKNMPCYVEKAYKCLKPGGMIAIQAGLQSSFSRIPEVLSENTCLLEEHEMIDLVCDGKFNNVQSKIFNRVFHFASNEEFLAWFKASSHINFEDLGEDGIRSFQSQVMDAEPDGRLRLHFKDFVQITGQK